MRALDAANRELRRRSVGALSLRWYAGAVQGDESEVVRKIRSRRLDGGALTATGLQQIHRPVLAFQLPAMFETPEEFLRAYTVLRPDLEAGFERAGVTLVHLSPAFGPRMFSTREVRVPGDLRACRPWQWRDDPILPVLHAEAGATGVPLALPEVLGALQTGRVDTVYAPPFAAIALQWATHVRTMSERSASGSLSAVVVSRATWDSLPEDHRALLRDVFAQMATVFRPTFLRAEQHAEETLRVRGVTVTTLTEAERAQWRALFARVRSRLAATLADPGWVERVRAASHP
jgi:TRAP-type C4-dicarboxylate transport system substrate-binding protein